MLVFPRILRTCEAVISKHDTDNPRANIQRLAITGHAVLRLSDLVTSPKYGKALLTTSKTAPQSDQSDQKSIRIRLLKWSWLRKQPYTNLSWLTWAFGQESINSIRKLDCWHLCLPGSKPNFCLTCLTSPGIRGLPWTRLVLWSSEPNPIVVVSLFKEGWSLLCLALTMAVSMASRSESLFSMCWVCH
jgi:hypothetical protein